MHAGVDKYPDRVSQKRCRTAKSLLPTWRQLRGDTSLKRACWRRPGSNSAITLWSSLSLRGSSRVEAAVVVVASSNSVAYVYIYRACITGYVKLQDRIFSFVCCFCGSLRSACVFPFYLLLVLACCFLFVCAFAFQFSCFFAFPLLCLAFSASWIAK